jgi:hypothetical protein
MKKEFYNINDETILWEVTGLEVVIGSKKDNDFR